MTSLPRLRLVTAAALAVLGLAGGLFALLHSSPAGAQSEPQLDPPDLVQVAPNKISVERVVRQGKPRYRLIFASAVEVPHESGPMILVAHRSSRKSVFLRADQYVDIVQPGSSTVVDQEVVRDVGRLRYVYASTHEHFHYLGFDRYELRRASDNRRVSHDRKSGFCLGDRYLVGSGSSVARGASFADRRPSARASIVTTRELDQECGSGKPKLLTVKEGITPGNGDNYKPSLEGQFLDLTGVPAGRYRLVHRVNSDRKLHETTFTNDVASALIELKRSKTGRPTVRVLKRCTATALCA